MLEQIISVQDMIAIGLLIGIIIKYIQRKEKW